MTSIIQVACPLCGGDSVEIVERLSGTRLRALWEAVGNPLSDAALGDITPQSAVDLHRCGACGFRFFDPTLAGSAFFYEELMAGRPYPSTSPEFASAVRFAADHGVRKILDIGGGEGAFLDLAKIAGFETLGIELNRNASKVAGAKGHRMFDRPMEEISDDDLGGGADMVTLFQVVEHVPAPVEFVRAASSLVRPGGYLLVAVPSSKRMLGLLHHDPLDWPPHHISRWRPADLSKLGERAGLDLVQSGADPFLGSSLVWAADLHRKLESAIGNKPFPLNRTLVKSASLIYRGLRMKHFMPFHGLSIHAVFRKNP